MPSPADSPEQGSDLSLPHPGGCFPRPPTPRSQESSPILPIPLCWDGCMGSASPSRAPGANLEAGPCPPCCCCHAAKAWGKLRPRGWGGGLTTLPQGNCTPILHAQPWIPFPGPRRALGAQLSSSPCPAPALPPGKVAQPCQLPAWGPSSGRGGHGCHSQGRSVLGGDGQQGARWRRGRARAQRELAVGHPGGGRGWPWGRGDPRHPSATDGLLSPPEHRGSRDREVSTAAEGCRDARGSVDPR